MLNDTDFRVAVLCSTRAPGLPELLEADAQARGWTLAGVITSDPECRALPDLARSGVLTAVHDIRQFYRARGARLGDLAIRREYDYVTVDVLDALGIDLVVLCGYLHIVTAPLLEAYGDRVINVHDADLTLLDEHHLPRYRGLRSTRDAVFAGERETRSTVHVVTADVDVGPPIVRSGAFATHPMVNEARRWGAASTDMLKAYAYAQREWMMRATWGALLIRAIELMARGEVRVLDGRAVVRGGFGPVELPAPRTEIATPWCCAEGA